MSIQSLEFVFKPFLSVLMLVWDSVSTESRHFLCYKKFYIKRRFNDRKSCQTNALCGRWMYLLMYGQGRQYCCCVEISDISVDISDMELRSGDNHNYGESRQIANSNTMAPNTANKQSHTDNLMFLLLRTIQMLRKALKKLQFLWHFRPNLKWKSFSKFLTSN